MERILLKLQYDGTNYSGFQIQKDKKSIQGEIQNALKTLFKQEIEIFGCSRTDAGVSAYEYYAHFDIETKIPANKICFALNEILPNDIKVLSSCKVSDNFHARFDVKNKTYVYSVYVSQHIMPLLDRYAVRIDKFPQSQLMQKASAKLIGTHDFSSFRTQDPSKKETNNVRKINFIKFQQKDNVINFFINGDGFLYNMVRIIVGTLIEVGYGKKSVQDIENLLISKDRTKAGKTMQAKGLKLYSVNLKSNNM